MVRRLRLVLGVGVVSLFVGMAVIMSLLDGEEEEEGTAEAASAAARVDFRRVKMFEATPKTTTATATTTERQPPRRPPRVFCWILATAKTQRRKAKPVKDTWGKRCDGLVFFSTLEDPSLPSVDLGVQDSYKKLWGKVKAANVYVWDHFGQDYDFFLKADDDTYVHMENLKELLKAYPDPDEEKYIGAIFQTPPPGGPGDFRKFKGGIKYMVGGAGYLLSRGALKTLAEKGLKPYPPVCLETDAYSEDEAMGECLLKLNIECEDTRDSGGRNRFFQYSPEELLVPGLPRGKWYDDNSYYKEKDGGLDSVASEVVSFHNLRPEQLYVYEYLLYNFKKM